MRPENVLSEVEIEVVGQCLKAATCGPFFPDWEFHTLFGINRSEALEISRAWPNVDLKNEIVYAGVVGAVGQLLGYPHGYSLDDYVNAGDAELIKIIERIVPHKHKDVE